MQSLLSWRRAVAGAWIVATGLLTPSPSAAQAPNVQSTTSAIGVADANSDLVFTPVTPCRVIDTRVAGGSFSAGTVRNYDLIGPVSYAVYGGNPAGCNIPATFAPVTLGAYGNSVRALVLNFSALPLTGNGNLRAWPTNQSVPTAAVVTYGLSMYSLTNGIPVATCDATTSAGDPCPGGDLSIQADSNAAHVVVDVVGYYTPQRYVLATNRTQYGVFAIDFIAPAALDQHTTGFSFSPPLASAPSPHFILAGFPSTPQCPGSAANPQAIPGHLCLYETISLNVFQYCISHQLGTWRCDSADPPGADPIGAALKVSAIAPGRVVTVGVWAVTAP